MIRYYNIVTCYIIHKDYHTVILISALRSAKSVGIGPSQKGAG